MSQPRTSVWYYDTLGTDTRSFGFQDLVVGQKSRTSKSKTQFTVKDSKCRLDQTQQSKAIIHPNQIVHQMPSYYWDHNLILSTSSSSLLEPVLELEKRTNYRFKSTGMQPMATMPSTKMKVSITEDSCEILEIMWFAYWNYCSRSQRVEHCWMKQVNKS